MDSAQAILTVLGYRANQGGQATLIYPDGCLWQEQVLALALGLELEFEQELEVELELVAGQAGTGCLASKAGRAAQELELGPGLWL